MFRRRLFIASLLVAASAAAISAQQKVKDHPLVSRFQGSDVKAYKQVEFDAFELPLGPIANQSKWAKSQTVEGKVTSFTYTMPENRSSLEVIRSYQAALKAAGFQTLFSCDTGCVSEKAPFGYSNERTGIWCSNCEEPMRYVAAKLARPEGDAYVTIAVVKDKYEGGTWLNVVEVKPMETGNVTVNAAVMAKDITATGHAVLYGVYFDTGKAIIKPESDPTLSEIAKLLGNNPDMKIHVIGHTDNVGTMASNMALSKQRAEAVVAALISKFKIAPARLDANGVGPLAPVATNRSEDGRAKNRRVELVEQ
jgi:OOP family OmpA-OmpF porin